MSVLLAPVHEPTAVLLPEVSLDRALLPQLCLHDPFTAVWVVASDFKFTTLNLFDLLAACFVVV